MSTQVRSSLFADLFSHARIQRGTEVPEKSQNIGFLSNTCPDPLKNHKATRPAFIVGTSSARQRNAI